MRASRRISRRTTWQASYSRTLLLPHSDPRPRREWSRSPRRSTLRCGWSICIAWSQAPRLPRTAIEPQAAELLFVRELARRVEGIGITPTPLDPRLRTNQPWPACCGWTSHAAYLTRPCSPRPNGGCYCVISLHQRVTVVTGGYYANGHPKDLGGLAKNDSSPASMECSAQALVSLDWRL